jgi:selenocysteine lyase/cysteine desulfurase
MNAIFNKDGYMELKDLPARLEAGTPNIEGVIGLSSAIDYINSIGIDKIHKYEHELREYLIDKLSQLDFISIYKKQLPLKSNKIVLGWTVRNYNEYKKYVKLCDNLICENIL